MDPALHRSLGDLEETGDLDAGQVPGMAQGKDQAIVRVELIEGPVQLSHGEGVVKSSGWCGMVHVELDEPMLALRHSECGANDLATKPGREGIRIAEGVKAEPGREQRLLDGVSSGISRACDQPRRSERRRQVRADELPECITIAGASGFDEGGEARPWAGRHRGHT